MSVKDDMNISERAAYLKGLSEGLELDVTKPEGKLITSMIDLIYSMADESSELEDEVELLNEQNDELCELLSEVDYDDYDEENPDYEVKCPDCGAEIVVDEDTLIEGEMCCPNCGGELEFDFSDLFSDETSDDCSVCGIEED